MENLPNSPPDAELSRRERDALLAYLEHTTGCPDCAGADVCERGRKLHDRWWRAQAELWGG